MPLQELKQEVYSLRNKLATATSQEAWYNDEIAQLQTMRKQESEIQDALKEEVIRLQRKVINILFLCHEAKPFRCNRWFYLLSLLNRSNHLY